MRQGNWALNVPIHARTDGNAAYSNMPAAASFLFNSHRHVQLVDLDGMTVVRFMANKQTTAGASGATLTLRYAKAFSTSVSAYSDIGPVPAELGIDVTNTILDTDWLDLHPSAAEENVYLAVIGEGGDGTLDPGFGLIRAAFA